MLNLTVGPEALAAAAADAQAIGSALSTANTAMAPTTTGVLAAGADEVSMAIASVFSNHGLTYQSISAQAATFHSPIRAGTA